LTQNHKRVYNHFDGQNHICDYFEAKPMTQRTGVPTLINTASKMCKIILLFSPTIRRIYPDAVVLHLALETAMAACGELEKELEKVRAYGD
jgi:hypothetical protein